MTSMGGGSLQLFRRLAKTAKTEGSRQTPRDFPLGKSRGIPKGCERLCQKPENPRWHDKGAQRLVLWNKVYHATLSREGGGANGTYA